MRKAKNIQHTSVHDCGWDLAEWLERLDANVKIASVLGSTPASSATNGAPYVAVVNKT
jgi:hypothetical protein